jgi:hypothetical protein
MGEFALIGAERGLPSLRQREGARLGTPGDVRGGQLCRWASGLLLGEDQPVQGNGLGIPRVAGPGIRELKVEGHRIVGTQADDLG